jgi:hypothetical protein
MRAERKDFNNITRCLHGGSHLREIYSKRTRFMFDINDVFFLARNLDQLREYAGDRKWRTERPDDDTILDYFGDQLLSRTTYLDDNTPDYLKAEVVITGLEDYPFILELTLEEKGKNQAVLEYRITGDIPEEFDLEAIRSTIDEFRKTLYGEVAKAAHNLELERRREETAVPFIDLDDDD